MEKREIGEIQAVIDRSINIVNNEKLFNAGREILFRFNYILTKNLKECCVGGV